MPAYANAGGNSNVESFEIAPDEQSIAVTFRGGEIYTYTTASTGKADLARMILFARAGIGLNSYITRKVKKRYASKGSAAPF